MKALTYLIRLQEPVLATQAASGEPNSATTSPCVPGSMVRGAVMARLFGGETLDPARTHRRFFDGTVRFLNAYPAQVAEGEAYTRLLPAPLSWRTDKYPSEDDQNRVFDLAVQKKELQRPKSFSPDDEPRFVVIELSAGVAHWKTPRRQLAVHNASDDRNEKRAGKSQVYRYEALAAGEMLAGVILGPDTDVHMLEKSLDKQAMMLGGSRTGGYGLATVEQVKIAENWQECAAAVQPSGSTVIVTLLSDAIVRLPTGGFANSLDSLLGRTAAQSFVDIKIVGGFNRKWGLPLPQMWAMAAGSVFVYENVSPSDAQVIRERAAAGLGERQAEGFGRAAVNWHTAPSLLTMKIEGRKSKPVSLTSDATVIAQRMADRQWRAQLETALIEKVVNIPISGSLPSPAQMARVRLAARQALFTRTLAPLVEHLKSLFDEETKRPKRGAQQLGEAYVDGRSMLTWIRERAQKPDLSYLTEKERPSVAGVAARSTPDFAVEFTARLIDGVMKRAVKEAQRRRAGGNHE